MNFDSPSTFSSFASAATTGASAFTSTALASTAGAAATGATAAGAACPANADRGISKLIFSPFPI